MKPQFVTAAAVIIVGGAAFLAGRASISTDASAASTSGSSGSSLRSSHLESSTGENGRPARGRGDTTSSAKASLFSGSHEERLAKLESILRGEDPLARNRALLDYLDQVSPSEIQATIEGFRTMGITESRLGEYSLMLAAWAKVDPTGALTYAKDQTKGPFATNTILTTWATRDPDAALQWAQSAFQGDGANPYLAGVIRGMASSDPNRASDLLTAMPLSTQRGEALNGLLPHILSQGDSTAREWITSIQDERLRNGAIDRAADQLAQRDPKGTADWLIANPGEGTQRNMDNVLSTWTDKDLQAATDYYQALPNGDTRTNALRGIVDSLAKSNPQEAANFIDSHAADVNDGVLQQFARNTTGSNPALAVNYIGKITDPRARDNQYRRTLDNWMRRDETSARAWLQSNRLPDSMQTYVQRRLGQ